MGFGREWFCSKKIRCMGCTTAWAPPPTGTCATSLSVGHPWLCRDHSPWRLLITGGDFFVNYLYFCTWPCYFPLPQTPWSSLCWLCHFAHFWLFSPAHLSCLSNPLFLSLYSLLRMRALQIKRTISWRTIWQQVGIILFPQLWLKYVSVAKQKPVSA